MKVVFLFLTILVSVISVEGQVIQWRGPERDGHFNEKGLLKQWPDEGPRQVLEVEGLGKGYSSPIVTGNTIYVTGMKDTLDYLTAIDFSGNVRWQVPYGRSWNKSFPETRCSPTIDGDRVYVLSGLGKLSCMNAQSGALIWSVDVDKIYQAEYHEWGVAESPLVVDDKVICSPGGRVTSVVAFDKMTGKAVWQSEPVGGPRSYVSPTVYKYNSIRYILAATASHLIALNPESGKIAWTYKYFDADKWKWQNNGVIWTNTPLYRGNEIFVYIGYDYPAVMLQMDPSGNSVSEKYRNTTLDTHHHGAILVDGYVYGSNWISNGKGKWVCMDWETGAIKYETDWNNKGSIVYADGMLYVYEEKGGNVGLVKPNPEKWEVVSSFKVTKGSGPHWAHPFISNGKLYLRHGEVLLVYDIKA